MSSPHEYRPIRVLDETLVNQIAAGEVVERPASAVKELVENSLDAGATQISVVVTDGGTREIRVIDDGCGIAPEELSLATQRHATSKVSTASDLEGITSFGFRGEALSSLASVSDFEVRSRRPSDPLGHQLRVAYGTPAPVTSVGSSAGTTMIVRELFARLPARQKFLRSAATEFTHIAKIFRELAMANPEVEFSLTHNDRTIHRYQRKALPEGLKDRFTDVLRPEWTPTVHREEAEFGSVIAFLSPAGWVSDRGELFLYVNRRPVKNRTLLSAIRNVYAAVLGPNHEPSGAVYLDVRYDWIDVNVHPQKWEVRCFHQERLYAWLSAAVRKGLMQEMALPGSTFGPGDRRHPPSPAHAQPFAWNSGPALPLPGLRYLGEVGPSAQMRWHVAEEEKGLVFFDPHSLGERRVLAEARVTLPTPKIVPFPRKLLPWIEESREALPRFGYDVEVFGEGDIAMKSYPGLVSEGAAGELLGLLAEAAPDLKQESDPVAVYRKVFGGGGRHLPLRTVALSPAEVRATIERWGDVDEKDTCPHGRPFLFRLTWDFVGKQFERGKPTT